MYIIKPIRVGRHNYRLAFFDGNEVKLAIRPNKQNLTAVRGEIYKIQVLGVDCSNNFPILVDNMEGAFSP